VTARRKGHRRDLARRALRWGRARLLDGRLGAPFSVIPSPRIGTPTSDDPRFASIWTYVQAEVTRTALHFRDLALTRMCHTVLATRTVEENGVEIEEAFLTRPATPEEIADPTAFTKEKREATVLGYHAARACARRLTRYYGLRSRYA
jgi:hypothetical protein